MVAISNNISKMMTKWKVGSIAAIAIIIPLSSSPSMTMKIQASIAANTWVVSGAPQTKKLQDILPSIIHQLGPDNLENLKKLAEQFQKQAPEAAGAGATAAQEEDDDEVPDLVAGETFETAAEEKTTEAS
ncbi:hypothetical protein K1719_013582 [Acacia pycnantha]|nr:hypothetical protein K1719_013582 [Acacia pycnantha]